MLLFGRLVYLINLIGRYLPIPVPLGSEQGLITGVEKAIGSMQVNEVARVVIKGDYIATKMIRDERLPDDAELTYDIRLNKFVKVVCYSRVGVCQSLLHSFHLLKCIYCFSLVCVCSPSSRGSITM